MKIKLKNIRGFGYSFYSDVISISGETDAFRYHIWVDKRTLKPQNDFLHRNPLTPGTGLYHALRQSSVCNHDLVKQLLDAAPTALATAQHEFEQEQEHERHRAEQRRREQHIRDAAPKLYEIVRQLQAWYGNSLEGPHAGSLLFDDEHSLLHHIDEAITEAERK